MKDEEEDAAEEEYRTVWEQDGENASKGAGPPGPDKRPRPAADEEEELPEEVQARLKALRGL